MSLFSRLDRVRDKAKLEAEAEESVFSVPDLGPRDDEDAPRRVPSPMPMPESEFSESKLPEAHLPAAQPAAESPMAMPASTSMPESVPVSASIPESAPVQEISQEIPFVAATPSLESALVTPPVEMDEIEADEIMEPVAQSAMESVAEPEEELVVQSYARPMVSEPVSAGFDDTPLDTAPQYLSAPAEETAPIEDEEMLPMNEIIEPEPEPTPVAEAAPVTMPVVSEMAPSEPASSEAATEEITDFATMSLSPVATPVEVPVESPVEEPSIPVGRSSFDRLMAANAEAEEIESRATVAPVSAPPVASPSVAEPPVSGSLPWEESEDEAPEAAIPEAEAPAPMPVAAVYEPAVPEPAVAAAPEPMVPEAEALEPVAPEPAVAEVAEPEAESLPDFLSSSAPTVIESPVSEAAPEVQAPRIPEPVAATPVVVPPAIQPTIVPPSAASPALASPDTQNVTPLGRPTPVPITRERPINSGTGVRSPIDRLNAERPLMENPVPVPDRPAVERPSAELAPAERPFNDRFAGRAGLDRDVEAGAALARTAESQVSSDSEPSRAPLARVENDAAQSEREAKNRAIYRRKHLMFDSVLGSIDPRQLQNPTRESLRPAIEKGVDGALREFNLALEPAERNWLIEEFLRETTDFGPLVSLLDDPGVNKILVSGSSDVTIEKLGRMERTGISFRDDDHLLSIIRRLAETVGGRIDAKVPLLDRPLPDGARVRAKIPPMAPQPTLTLEKSTGNPFVVLKRQQAERGRGDNLPYAQLRERIQQRLVREFEGDSLSMGNTDRLRGQVEEMINAVILEERVAVTRAERAALVMDLLNEIVGLGPIEPLLNDPEVDEVMVNGPYQIYVERKGKLELSPQRFRDNAHVMQVIDRIVAPLGRRVDEKSPMVDGRLRDGSRFNAIIPPLALSGPTMTIRKFARDPFTMTDLINFGTLTRDAAQFLQAAVEGRLNIVVSGGTGSGKTTTLNVLSSFIPTTERIVTIEDAAELQLRQEHVIRLETRPPNIEGIGEVGIRDLVRNSLRMRPDHIVVGECRGGEALDMLQAMNTGHDGSLTTGHSNGPRDTLKRLETIVMMAGFDLPVKAIREQISMAVQMIVHQERMRDGKRRITAISELVGMEGDVITMQDIFRFEQERIDDDGRIIGALVPTGLRPKNFDTIIDNGVELSMELFHPRPSGDGGVRSRLDQRMGGR